MIPKFPWGGVLILLLLFVTHLRFVIWLLIDLPIYRFYGMKYSHINDDMSSGDAGNGNNEPVTGLPGNGNEKKIIISDLFYAASNRSQYREIR